MSKVYMYLKYYYYILLLLLLLLLFSFYKTKQKENRNSKRVGEQEETDKIVLRECQELVLTPNRDIQNPEERERELYKEYKEEIL